ncbi:MAG: hypothetical protein AAF989_04975 [Planctomycetota bacterium]
MATSVSPSHGESNPRAIRVDRSTSVMDGSRINLFGDVADDLERLPPELRPPGATAFVDQARLKPGPAKHTHEMQSDPSGHEESDRLPVNSFSEPVADRSPTGFRIAIRTPLARADAQQESGRP